MKHSDILKLAHTTHTDDNGICKTMCDEGYYLTAWFEGDDILQYSGSKVMINRTDLTDTKEYADVRIITEEYHLEKEAEKQAILDAKREQEEKEREEGENNTDINTEEND